MIGWRYREALSRQFAGIGLLGEPVLAGQERAVAKSVRISQVLCWDRVDWDREGFLRR